MLWLGEESLRPLSGSRVALVMVGLGFLPFGSAAFLGLPEEATLTTLPLPDSTALRSFAAAAFASTFGVGTSATSLSPFFSFDGDSTHSGGGVNIGEVPEEESKESTA